MKHTVAIPTFRRSAELRKALNAMVTQQRPADELIVTVRVDDLESGSVLAEFKSLLPIRQETLTKPGVVEAINRILEVASGDIITFTDDDAVPPPDWAKQIVQGFIDAPDLAGLGGRDHIHQNGAWIDGETPEVGIVRWYGRITGNHHLGTGPRRDVDCLKGVNFSLRRESLEKLRVDSRLRGTGAQWHWELDLCMALRAQGKRLAYDPSILVDHLPAQRLDEDQRNTFNALAYENQIHNQTLVLLKYLSPAGRALLLPYALLIGLGNGYCGLLKGLLQWPLRGNNALLKTRASVRGVFAGWNSWRSRAVG
jgi:cellulose synthase/poly-beta-1,6-N-acetylglucosamine synthase-like glycosyltransferase